MALTLGVWETCRHILGTGEPCCTGSDSRMSPDLLRCTGKSIGGDLNVDDEGSEQRQFKPVQSLHHGSVDYQPVHT
jgi:hypothetical protein